MFTLKKNCNTCPENTKMKKTFFYLLKRLKKKRIFSFYQSHLWTTIFLWLFSVCKNMAHMTNDVFWCSVFAKIWSKPCNWVLPCLYLHQSHLWTTIYPLFVLNLHKYGTNKKLWNFISVCCLVCIFKRCLVWLGESASHSQGQLP